MQNAECKMQNCGVGLIKRKGVVRQVRKQKSSFDSFLARKECLSGEDTYQFGMRTAEFGIAGDGEETERLVPPCKNFLLLI